MWERRLRPILNFVIRILDGRLWDRATVPSHQMPRRFLLSTRLHPVRSRWGVAAAMCKL